MTNRTTLTLMAAVLLLSVEVQPRAQSSDGEPTAEESLAYCPCGDPASLVPLATWSSDNADCSSSGPMTARTPTRTELYGFSFEGGVVSLSSTVYGRDCRWVINASDLDIQERPISQPEVEACSRLIISYAQSLKDAGQVAVGDFGCKLR